MGRLDAAPSSLIDERTMKPLALIFALIGIASAQEVSRKWTDTQGRSIEGTLVAKTKTIASVKLASGKLAELPLAKLDADSNAYVAAAVLKPVIQEVAPKDMISARVTGMGKGTKTVEVTARAGPKQLTVVVPRPPPRGPIQRVVEPGTVVTFEFTAADEYTVTGSIDGAVVDTEDSRRKTGL